MLNEIAIFAMGCFWCGESEFRDKITHNPLPGIVSIRVGYAGGVVPNPTYYHHEGYKEAVKITYDANKISYEHLLAIFWRNIDPLNADGQFCDIGPSYTSAIFYTNATQKKLALKTKEDIKGTLKKTAIATEILPYTTFYEAEDYHQNYQVKNPVRYKYYRWRCGRDKRLSIVWGN
jgi:peptide-methionine (S)-S-oxide reductase